MLSRIENAQVFKRFMVLYRNHNAQCPIFTVSRTCKTTGRITEFNRQKGVITESVKTTFYMILREYVESYVKTAITMPAGMYTNANPPSLLTNSVKLGILCDCSDRTVRNHLAQLRELGVLQTKFHGRKHDYELWISQELLYGDQGERVLKKADFGLKTDLSSLNMKNFPVNNTHRELLEKEKGSADMLIKHRERIHGEGGRPDNNPSPSKDTGMGTEKDQTGGAPRILTRAEIVAQNDKNRRQRASDVLEPRQLKGPKHLEAKFLNLLLEFWFYAWKVLYPNREFSKEQQEKALIAISEGVYNNFEGERSERQWVDFQILQLSKLDKAGKYYDHHPEQYAPDPFDIAVAGKGYFSALNLKGFTAIDGWVKKELLQQAINRAGRENKKLEISIEQDRRCRKLLREARIDMENLKAGLPLRNATKGKNIIGIYQYYDVILRSIGRRYSDMLARQFTLQQARDFARPKYDKAKRMKQLAAPTLSHQPSPATVVYVQDWMEGDGEGYYTAG